MKSVNDSRAHSGAAFFAVPPNLREMVQQCRRRDFLQEMQSLYAHLDAEIARLGLQCLGGGCCCKFDLTGQILLATTGELAVLLAEAPPQPQRCLQRRCPFQSGPRCLAHQRRTIGCRTHFCRASDQERLYQLNEAYHRKAQLLHETFSMPYCYTDILAGICEIYHI